MNVVLELLYTVQYTWMHSASSYDCWYVSLNCIVMFTSFFLGQFGFSSNNKKHKKMNWFTFQLTECHYWVVVLHSDSVWLPIVEQCTATLCIGVARLVLHRERFWIDDLFHTSSNHDFLIKNLLRPKREIHYFCWIFPEKKKQNWWIPGMAKLMIGICFFITAGNCVIHCAKFSPRSVISSTTNYISAKRKQKQNNTH